MSTDRSLQVLVVGPDVDLVSELDLALAGAAAQRAVLTHARSFADAAATFGARTPDLVCVELGSDAAALRRFAADVRLLAPDALLLGVHSPDALDASDASVLVEALRAQFADVIRRPLSSGDLRGCLVRLAERLGAASSGRIVAFHSTKGGVGKSTLSINAACGLARTRPDQVLLVDCSLQLGVCSAAIDLEPTATLADAARESDRLDARLLRELAEPHPGIGLRLLAAPRDAADAADVSEAALARILGVARRAFELVVVDTLPIVDGVMLGVLDVADRIYLVNQGTVPDVIGAARLLEVLARLGIDASRLRVVLNRNTPRFPGRLTTAVVASRLGREVDFEVPYDRRIFTALNMGVPRILKAGRFGWGRVMRRIVSDIESLAPTAGPSAGAGDEAAERTATGWRPAEVRS